MTTNHPRPAGLEIIGFEKRTDLRLPLYLFGVQAGFPSPADDYIDKRLEERKGRLFLAPANPDYPATDVTDREGFEVWGVVCHVIHKV